MLLYCLYLFLFTWLCLPTGSIAGQKGHQSVDRLWKKRMTGCERNNCASLPRDESANCVNECTSPACFHDIYSFEPLEDGEIDKRRENLFTNCLRKEARQQEKQARSRRGADGL